MLAQGAGTTGWRGRQHRDNRHALVVEAEVAGGAANGNFVSHGGARCACPSGGALTGTGARGVVQPRLRRHQRLPRDGAAHINSGPTGYTSRRGVDPTTTGIQATAGDYGIHKQKHQRAGNRLPRLQRRRHDQKAALA